ncbi:hypothetical protein B0H14DRAFT_700447 [Mycena olivaceomarginata]|nr:hypothetical protein B0H14DRAFT_700447 [Mycena olivaceomarginata]
MQRQRWLSRSRSSSSAPATRAKAPSSSRCASSTACPSLRRRPSPFDSWCLIISRGGSNTSSTPSRTWNSSSRPRTPTSTTRVGARVGARRGRGDARRAGGQAGAKRAGGNGDNGEDDEGVRGVRGEGIADDVVLIENAEDLRDGEPFSSAAVLWAPRPPLGRACRPAPHGAAGTRPPCRKSASLPSPWFFLLPSCPSRPSSAMWAWVRPPPSRVATRHRGFASPR